MSLSNMDISLDNSCRHQCATGISSAHTHIHTHTWLCIVQ